MYVNANLIFHTKQQTFPFVPAYMPGEGYVRPDLNLTIHPPTSFLRRRPLAQVPFYLLKFSSFAISHYVNSVRANGVVVGVFERGTLDGAQQGDGPLYFLHVRTERANDRPTDRPTCVQYADDVGKSSAHTHGAQEEPRRRTDEWTFNSNSTPHNPVNKRWTHTTSVRTAH